MPYLVTCPAGESVSVPRALDRVTWKDESGEQHEQYVHETEVYTRGAVLDDDQVSPVVVELLKNGDPSDKIRGKSVLHVRSVLRPISEQQAAKYRAKPDEGMIEVKVTDDPLTEQVKRNPRSPVSGQQTSFEAAGPGS